MKKAIAALAVVVALVLATVAFATTNEASGPSHATAVAASAASTISCSKAKIGVMAPLTGGAASVGQEQKNWVKFLVARANKANHTKFGIVEGDTQLNAGQALIVAKQFASNKNILATVGPAGSQEVLSAGPALKGKLAFISGSATNVTLTDGRFRGWFFRTVGSDRAQGKTDATYVAKVLKAKDVEIIDDQTSYATGLAAFASSTFKALKVKVRRASVSQSQADFSSVISSSVDAEPAIAFKGFRMSWLTMATIHFSKSRAEASCCSPLRSRSDCARRRLSTSTQLPMKPAKLPASS